MTTLASPPPAAALTTAAASDLDRLNAEVAELDPASLIRWAGQRFGGDTSTGGGGGESGVVGEGVEGGLVMSSSFGAQSAALLHLVTRVLPDLPVILVDTGYLFPETYRFILDLKRRLGLNLHVATPRVTPAWLEAIHGRLWEQGQDGLARYHQLMKIEPMNRALSDLGATAWIAGLRRGQTRHRATLRRVEAQDGLVKIHPILDWTGRDVHDYLTRHDLPLHPLVERGYLSIGDTHSTRPVTADMDERDGRFGGVTQECGLHVPQTIAEDDSRFSSGL